MKRRYSRVLAVLAAAAMGTVMESSCTTGEPADTGDHCWFICDKSTEKTQAPPLTDAPLPLSQAVSGKPA